VTNASRLAGCNVALSLGLYENLLHDKSYLDYSGILKEAVAVLEHNMGLRERLKARIGI
jgi:DNA helicase II / ATP-dependent DNA helicase PcrA